METAIHRPNEYSFQGAQFFGESRNASLSCTFMLPFEAIKERVRWQLRADAFNVTNLLHLVSRLFQNSSRSRLTKERS